MSSGRPDGRTQEIQRLIGRSLRAVVDLSKLGDHTFYVDCDVLDADGGTRCASITGAAVALKQAFHRMFAAGELKQLPMTQMVAAVSVGMVDGRAVLDLPYKEDVAAAVDMNLVMTEDGRFVEVQGSGEEATFSRGEMDQLLALGERGIRQLLTMQRQALQAAAG